jgi:hypothetical protein
MQEANRLSTFVTVVGWLVAIFAGLSTLTGLMQSALVVFAFPTAPISESDAAGMPPGFRFLFDNFQWFVFTLTAFWAVALAGAVGLLKRKEWGRQLLLGLFMIAALGTAAIALLQQVMMNQIFMGVTDSPADANANTMIMILRIGSALFALAFVGALAWVAVRLNSPATRAEFKPA